MTLTPEQRQALEQRKRKSAAEMLSSSPIVRAPAQTLTLPTIAEEQALLEQEARTQALTSSPIITGPEQVLELRSDPNTLTSTPLGPLGPDGKQLTDEQLLDPSLDPPLTVEEYIELRRLIGDPLDDKPDEKPDEKQLDPLVDYKKSLSKMKRAYKAQDKARQQQIKDLKRSYYEGEAHLFGQEVAQYKAKQVEQEAQQTAKAEMAELESEVANYKLDPWAGSNKPLAVVATFLGGLTGGQNQASRIIENHLNRELNRQQAELDTKKGLLSRRTNLYQQMLRRSDNAEQARLKARFALLKEIDRKAAQVLATGQGASDASKANAQLLMATLDQKGAETEFRLAQSMAKAGVAGKKMTATESAKIGQGMAANEMLDNMQNEFDALSGDKWIPGEMIQAIFPGTVAFAWSDARDAYGMAIGKAIMKERFTDADRIFWANQMPDVWDSTSRAAAKIKRLRELVEISNTKSLKAMKLAGYDTSRFELEEAEEKAGKQRDDNLGKPPIRVK